jgi:hypothetical protein
LGGFEPPSPAPKAGALSVELHPDILLPTEKRVAKDLAVGL